MIAAIGIDDWKLSIFERRLREAGYAIISKTTLTEETLVLRVEFDDFNKMHQVIQDCQNEAAKLRSLN
jgi:hypothetical protein